jgi:hypothetical protein
MCPIFMFQKRKSVLQDYLKNSFATRPILLIIKEEDTDTLYM